MRERIKRLESIGSVMEIVGRLVQDLSVTEKGSTSLKYSRTIALKEELIASIPGLSKSSNNTELSQSLEHIIRLTEQDNISQRSNGLLKTSQFELRKILIHTFKKNP